MFEPVTTLTLDISLSATAPDPETNLPGVTFGFSDGDPTDPQLISPTFGFQSFDFDSGPDAAGFTFPSITASSDIFLTVFSNSDSPFSLSGTAVGSAPSGAPGPVIPLPPAAAGLAAGLVALAGVGRRRRRA